MDDEKLLSKDNKLGFKCRKHRCKVCNKLYELKSSLHRHMRIHEDLDEYKCKACSKQFSDTKSLTGHLLIHTDEKPYICAFCGYKFRNKSTLNVHEKRHGTEMPFKCDVCGKHFFVGVDLRKHVKIQHRDGKLECDHCDKEFYLPAAFERHYRSHTRRKPLECQYSEKYFTDQPSYNKHVDTHKEHGPFQDETRDYIDSRSKCNGMSSDISNSGFGDTQETLHSSEQLVCSVSITGNGKGYDTNRASLGAAEVRSRSYDERAPRNWPGAKLVLQQIPAITSVVNDKKDMDSYRDRILVNCPSAETIVNEGGKRILDKALEELDDIAVTRSDKDSEHNSSSTALEVESSYLRPDLRKTKAERKVVPIKSQRSNKLCHLNGKHRCKICNRPYEIKSSLNRHMRVHQDIDKYRCKICNKQFSDTRTLTGHLLIHTGEKPYECSFCKFKFRSKSTLNKHEKRHGTTRPYRCEFCEKKFFQGTDLRKHLKIHEVDKEFKCDLCDKQFYLKAQIRRHYRVHTGEKPFECNQCKRAFADKATLKRHEITHTGHIHDPDHQKTIDATSTKGRMCNRIRAAAGIYVLGIVKETKRDIVKSVTNGMDHTKVEESQRKTSKPVEERSRTIVKIKTTGEINLKRRPRKSVVQKRVIQQSFEKASVPKDITDVKLDSWDEHNIGINLDNTGMDIEENHIDNGVEQLEETVQANSDKGCTHDITSSVIKEESFISTNRRKDKKSNAGQVTVRKRQRKHTAKPHGIDLPDPILLESPNGESSTLMLPCKLCKKNCKNKASYIAHYKACLDLAKFQNPDSANKSYGCLVCEKVYKLKASLRRHMRVHQDLDEYKCEVCSKQFSDTKSLTGHLLIHTGEKPYSCSFCGFKFRNKSTLRSHETRHGTEMPFSCEVCDKKFFLGTDLRKHLKIHETDREFKCDQCARQFYLLAEFRRHYRKHTGERPFECQDCGKCFADQSSLKSHNVIHTGDKPFQCDICGATFSWQCRLDKHIRRHNNDRPHECNTCRKRFVQNSDLKTHERKHAAETNHECLRCGERFADSDSLSKHKRTHSPVKNNLCSYCGKAYVTPAVLKRHWTTCTKKMIIRTSDDYERYLDNVKITKNNEPLSSLFQPEHDRTTALGYAEKFRMTGRSLGNNNYKVCSNNTEILIEKSPEIPLNTFMNQNSASVPKNK